MNKKTSFSLIAAAMAVGVLNVQNAFAGDKYSSFQELAKSEVAGKDYKISLTERTSPYSVLAIHGGAIESSTSEIALDVAGNNLNLYLFEGTKSDNNWDLHVTSTQFNEPAALKLVAKSRSCVSIHGFTETKSKICLGGRNVKLAANIAREIKRAIPDTEIALGGCEGIDGEAVENIVNRCSEQGAQIEISGGLRKDLFANPGKRALFGAAVRRALTKSIPR